MQTFTATEAKNNFASVMEMALREPVMIEKNGRPHVMISAAANYETRRKMAATNSKKKRFDDDFFTLCRSMAATAQENGMTEEVLKSILESRD